MKLEAKQIKENWDNLLKCIEKNISSPRKEALLAFYKRHEERIILLPASHKIQYHNCFPGGYVDHVLNVVKYAYQLHKLWVADGNEETYSLEELMFVAINHDLGKIGNEEEEAYLPSQDEWRKNNLGEMYKYNVKIPYMTVPDRSLFLLNQEGIKMSLNETLGIKLHDGLYDEANKPYIQTWMPETKPRTALVYIIHMADMLAARKEFEREWLPKFKDNVDKQKEDSRLKSKPSNLNYKNKSLNTIQSKNLKNIIGEI